MNKSGGDSHDSFNGDYDTTVIADTDKLALHPLEKPSGDTHTGTLADVQLRRFEIKQGFIIIRRDCHEITHLRIRNDDGTMVFTVHNVTDRKRGALALFDGIEWVIVSLGANGAFAKHGDVFYKVDIPKIDVVNPVGSGDSTVAGIASGLYHHESDADLLKKANVLGMLNAQEAQTGHVNMGHYDALYQQLIVKEV